METDLSIRTLTGASHFTAAHTAIYVNHTTVHGDNLFPHDHDFLEIALMTAGEGQHQSVLGTQPLSAGDVVILRPGVWHAYRQCDRLGVYNCCLGMDLLQGELAFLLQKPGINYLLLAGPLALERRGMITVHLNPKALQASVAHLDSMAALTESTDPASMDIDLIGHLFLLLGQITRNMGPEYRLSTAHTVRVRPVVLQCRQLLNDHISDPWTLSELSNALHVAPSYLIRLFKDDTGLTPMAYLTRIRVERAASLLLRTDRTVSQIAEEVGWLDQNYFARRFKSTFGLSATEYRQRFHQPQDSESPPRRT